MIRAALALLLLTVGANAQSTWLSYTRAPPQYRNLPTGPARLIRLPTLDDSWRERMRRGVGGGSTACSFDDGTIVYSDPGDLPHELDHLRVRRAGGPNGHWGWR